MADSMEPLDHNALRLLSDMRPSNQTKKWPICKLVSEDVPFVRDVIPGNTGSVSENFVTVIKLGAYVTIEA